MNKSTVMMVGQSGVGETVEGKVKEALDNQEISFITLPDASDSAEVAGQIRRPWQIMEHLMLWDRRVDFDLVVLGINKETFPREKMISGDLTEVEELVASLSHDREAVVHPFYGEEVPDVNVNRQNAIMCYKLLTTSRQLVETIHDIFRRSDKYAQIHYDYLQRRGQREYLMNNKALYFAMTPEGLDLFRDFLVGQYDLLINGGGESLINNEDHQDVLMLKMRRSMQMNQLTMDADLKRIAKQVEDGWQVLMSDSGRPITECNREAGESVYSMVQFERMMAERRGENWHDWL